MNDASKELSADVADFADVRPMVVADPPPGVSSCPFRALHLRSLRNPWTTGLVVAGFMLLWGISTTARAQQTIFNVPSSDVLDKGKVYFELDATFKPNKDGDNVVPRFSSFVPRIVVGAGRRVEVGLNINGNIQPGPDSTTFVPAIKWKAYDGGDNGWAFVLGDHLFIPVRNRSYDAGNYVYGQVSKTLKTKTRLTAGVHDFSPDVVHPKNRAGGQFGFEQPVNSKFGFAADWFTHRAWPVTSRRA